MKDSLPRLTGSTTSPFVRKVRVTLIEKGIEHEFDPRSSWNPQSPANRLNPLQKVPVLEWPDREPMYDSRVIVQAIEHWVPSPALLPADPELRLQALQLEALADGVSDAAALYTQEGWRKMEARSAFWLERQRNKVLGGLEALDNAVTPWLPDADHPPGIVAIAAGSALGFVQFWQPALVSALSTPNLHALQERLSGRDAWTLTAPFVPEGARFPEL